MTSKEMSCTEIRESLLELATSSAASSTMERHLVGCADCAAELAEFRQTMAMLDEWSAPEPSPYFETRVMARVREESTLGASRMSWLGWMWKPVMGVALATALVAGVTVYQQMPHSVGGPVANLGANPATMAGSARGTAVADLQAFDESRQSYSDFEVLDELQPDGSEAGNAAQ